ADIARPVTTDHMEFEGRFFYEHIEEYYCRLPANLSKMKRDAKRIFAEYDVIIFRVPAPVSFPLAKIAKKMGKDTIVFVAGDVVKQTKYLEQGGIKAMMARLLSRHCRKGELKVAESAKLVVTWGEELLPIFAAANPITCLGTDPNVSKEDIFYREDTCTSETIRLTRICQVVDSKGIEYLLDAMAGLRKNGYDVRLEQAGFCTDPSYKERLDRQIAELGLEPYVKFHGMRTFPELLEIYRSCDIHVISS
ncbi:unnamed protein product, partial [marine sediment metagenome]